MDNGQGSPVFLVDRRRFICGSLAAALPAVLAEAAAPRRSNASTSGSRARGAAWVDVRRSGARGDGRSDDTRALQQAIDGLPDEGGTVHIPAGTYLIDAVRSVRLRSRMHLELAPGARLLAMPTARPKYRILVADLVEDVEVSGGEIIGERDRHLGSGGEGGHGIKIEASQRVTIRDTRISSGWGDGIVVGPKTVRGGPYVPSRDIVVANVVCTGNRRNALSIGNVVGMRVRDSEFSDTHGTSPQCGIDIEPDKDFDGRGYCTDVHIDNCLIRRNAVYGVNVWKRSRDITFTRCTIEENRSCGLVAQGVDGIDIIGNTIRNNGSTGLFLKEGATDCEVRDNIFQNNYTRQRASRKAVAVTRSGQAEGVRKHLIVGRGTSDVRVGANRFD